MEGNESLFGEQASILITGASSGIGAAIARRCAAYGGRIALVARREGKLEEVGEQVKRLGGQPLVLKADVTDFDAVTRAYLTAVKRNGPIRTAFLNAGGGEAEPIEAFSAHTVQSVFQLNVMGVAHWVHHLLPDMLQRNRGTIVAISSLAGTRGLPQSAIYSASKAALSVLIEALRLEAASKGVQLTTVEPGFVRTAMTDHERYPMPFMMEPAEAAERICDGVAEGKAVIRFPWPMTLATRALALLPTKPYELLARYLLQRMKMGEGLATGKVGALKASDG